MVQHWASTGAMYWPSAGVVMVQHWASTGAMYWPSTGMLYWPSAGVVMVQHWAVLVQCIGPVLAQYRHVV